MNKFKHSTCDCWFSVSENGNTGGFPWDIHSVDSLCEAHAGLTGSVQEIWDVVHEENVRQNELLRACYEISDITAEHQRIVEDGGEMRIEKVLLFKEGKKPKFKFDAQRKIEVSFPNITPEEKALISQKIGKIPSKSKIILK